MTITLMFFVLRVSVKAQRGNIVLVTWSWRSHGNSYVRVWRWSHRKARGQQMCFICVISRGLRMDRPFCLRGGRGCSLGFVSACRIMRLLRDRIARILCQVRRRWASSWSREGKRQSTALTYGIKDKSYKAKLIVLFVFICNNSWCCFHLYSELMGFGWRGAVFVNVFILCILICHYKIESKNISQTIPQSMVCNNLVAVVDVFSIESSHIQYNTIK